MSHRTSSALALAASILSVIAALVVCAATPAPRRCSPAAHRSVDTAPLTAAPAASQRRD
jgi:hypothetical protein